MVTFSGRSIITSVYKSIFLNTAGSFWIRQCGDIDAAKPSLMKILIQEELECLFVPGWIGAPDCGGYEGDMTLEITQTPLQTFYHRPRHVPNPFLCLVRIVLRRLWRFITNKAWFSKYKQVFRWLFIKHTISGSFSLWLTSAGNRMWGQNLASE